MQSVKRVPHGRIPLSPESRAIKDVLWSVHFHGAGLDRAAVPDEVCPMPLTDAMVAASQWDRKHDEHAADRRVRCLRRLHPEVLANAEKAPTRPKAKLALLADSKNPAWPQQYGRVFRIDLNVMDSYFSRVGMDIAEPDVEPCIVGEAKPDFDPKTGCTSVKSGFQVREELKPAIAWLLDPRCWDRCSDLFDSVCQVDEFTYQPLPMSPPLGQPWKGYLYECAGVGPQTVENVLRVDFKVGRACGRDRGHRPAACVNGTCSHIESVDVDYELYDSISYELGGIVLPGLMRQNHGYLRARPNGDTTEITCKKEIRFARWTDWSTGSGAFDYGQMLNYLAPAYLSLWIYDITQIVPCCKKIKTAAELRR